MSEWLENLQVGDKVVVTGGAFSRDGLATVARFTKTQIITKHGHKYRRTDGSPVPSRPGGGVLVEPTEERLNPIRQSNLAEKLKIYDWKTLPLEKLRKIVKLL